MHILRLITLAALAAFLVACASSNSGSSYSRDEARRLQTVRTGVVESVRAVNIEGTKTPVGTAAGAVVGGVAGSTVGHGAGSVVAGVIGAVQAVSRGRRLKKASPAKWH